MPNLTELNTAQLTALISEAKLELYKRAEPDYGSLRWAKEEMESCIRVDTGELSKIAVIRKIRDAYEVGFKHGRKG